MNEALAEGAGASDRDGTIPLIACSPSTFDGLLGYQIEVPWGTEQKRTRHLSADMRDLERHGNQLRVRLKVPTRLVPIVGRTKLVKGLGTTSVAKAHLLKRPILAAFHRLVADAERQLQSQKGSLNSPVVAEANEYRTALLAAIRNPKEDSQYDEHGEVIVDGPTFIRGLMSDKAEEMSRAGDREGASLFFSLASGEATPVLRHLETFLVEAGMKARQTGSYRTAVSKFDSWLVLENEPVTVEAIKPRTTGRYVSSQIAQQRHWKTINKEVSAISSYWRWLVKKGHAEINPWQGQSLRKRATDEDEEKRPFTDAEVCTLLGGDADDLLRDFMIVAALSALRINEIADLEVRDVADRLLKVRKSKTPAGVRTVPAHSDLASIIARRCTGKEDHDLLFHELRVPQAGATVERYQPVSKRFTRYRRKLGVDVRVEGKRQSVIDFHSFRRWFARKCFDALDSGSTGFSAQTVAELMGHKSGEKTLGMTIHYAGKGPALAKRACIEAIGLPREPL